ncbi:28180_t:CDS:2 [Gigaspora margarita]|uniref:28180_t:CDS:1 n=1 Tax=Gigaspora margarita TaxID=4874 RepID=A0ABN7UWL2_GIGMA|nr:28180_t:CDS:2 [Gigaspora margarita]
MEQTYSNLFKEIDLKIEEEPITEMTEEERPSIGSSKNKLKPKSWRSIQITRRNTY